MKSNNNTWVKTLSNDLPVIKTMDASSFIELKKVNLNRITTMHITGGTEVIIKRHSFDDNGGGYQGL